MASKNIFSSSFPSNHNLQLRGFSWKYMQNCRAIFIQHYFYNFSITYSVLVVAGTSQPAPCKSIPLVLLYLLRFVVFSLPFQLCLVYLVYIVLFRPLVYFGSICFGENIQAQTQFSPWISSYCSRCSIVHIIVINITMCVRALHSSTFFSHQCKDNRIGLENLTLKFSFNYV